MPTPEPEQVTTKPTERVWLDEYGDPRKPTWDEIKALPWPASAVAAKQYYGRDYTDAVEVRQVG
jgi:hypothetical protein